MSQVYVLARSLVVLTVSVAATASAWAQTPNEPRHVYRCTNAQGRTLTSDRTIAECIDREQRVYSSTGVLLRTISPTLTAEERAVVEARLERERSLKESHAEHTRRDRQLALRFPNEKAHQRARSQALESAELARTNIEKRLALLSQDRAPLDREAEFYVGKTLPLDLKRQYDTIEATETGLRTALDAQADETARVNELYDIELERLKKLWAGASPGSLGPLRAPASVTAGATRPSTPSVTTEPAAAPATMTPPKAGEKPKGGGGSGDAGGAVKTVSVR